MQRPGPPILMGADTVETVARVPEVADHWIASRRHTKAFLREAVPAYKAALERQGKQFGGLLFFAISASPIVYEKRRIELGTATSGAINATSSGVSRASAMILHSIS
jgi:alkanesulfonate monooxygenase SsuD/methylene tetrahydromethanopterin reductase-like flavin-dependent oxidoreductase (luciferase family)